MRLLDKRGDPATGVTVGLVPWMPAHNHGIPQDVTVSEAGAGAYEATFAFSMPGSWELQLDLDGEPGQDTARYEVEVQ